MFLSSKAGDGKPDAIPFEAEASNISSELNERVRMSVRCPGKSRE